MLKSKEKKSFNYSPGLFQPAAKLLAANGPESSRSSNINKENEKVNKDNSRWTEADYKFSNST